MALRSTKAEYINVTIKNITRMKRFNLEEFKKNPSRNVVTRYGKPVRIICTDAKGESPVVALVEDNGEEYPFSYHQDGTWSKRNTSDVDLFFDTVTKERICESVLYRLFND